MQVCEIPQLDDINERFGAPITPPDAWFLTKPGWLTPDTPNPQVVMCGPEMGRFGAYVAQFGREMLGSIGMRFAPRGMDGDDYFHRRPVPGSTVKAGLIGLGHSPSSASTVQLVQQFHDDPRRGKVLARYHEDNFGPYVIGAVVPEATWLDVIQIQRTSISGEWFKQGGRHVFLAPALVSHPANPMADRRGATQANGQRIAASFRGGVVRAGHATPERDLTHVDVSDLALGWKGAR